jgi:hypothetical protein
MGTLHSRRWRDCLRTPVARAAVSNTNVPPMLRRRR